MARAWTPVGPEAPTVRARESADGAAVANVTWGIQPAVDVGFAQAPECRRLASRDARYPGSFDFTAGVAVFAWGVEASHQTE